MGVAEIKMNEYKLALDITAKYQAKNDRCARQYIEFRLGRFLRDLNVTYKYVRINGEKPENFGRVK